MYQFAYPDAMKGATPPPPQRWYSFSPASDQLEGLHLLSCLKVRNPGCIYTITFNINADKLLLHA
jgi:hypothetical protein